MKKKIKDLTADEVCDICGKNSECTECPLQDCCIGIASTYMCIQYFKERNINRGVLEQEIELVEKN